MAKRKPAKNTPKPARENQKGNRASRRIVGVLLLVSGVILLSSLYWPKIYAAIGPTPKINQTVLDRGHFWIVIPKIKVDSPVQPAVTKQFLAMGVGHVPESGYPGEGRNTIIAGHNYDPAKWTPQTTFGLLYELEKGDEVLVAKQGEVYEYVVREKETLDADDPALYAQTKHEQLTLLTCKPYQNTTKRLKVIALPK